MSSIFVSNGRQALDKDILCLKSTIIAMNTELNIDGCDVQRQVTAIHMGKPREDAWESIRIVSRSDFMNSKLFELVNC
jgi:hypothetical protein